MKKILNLRVCFALVLLAAPLASQAAVFFSDYFTNSSTLNQAPVDPTTNSTSYQTMVGLAGGTNSLTSSGLNLTFPINSGVLGEVMALYTNASAPTALAAPGDHIDLTIVFINSSNILGGVDTANASINVGLFNAGGINPNQGNIVLSTGTTAGGTEDWLGYFGRFLLGTGNCTVRNRPAQTPVASSQNQDLLFSNASGSQSFNNPQGVAVGNDAAPTGGGALMTNGATYTIHFTITLTDFNVLTISNALYAGAGTGTTPMATQIRVTTTTPLTTAFNGFAVGWRNTSGNQGSSMTITSVDITGQATAITAPPDINNQPLDVTVAPNGSCAFFVKATGFGVTYQWKRYGTNLVNGGNISGANSDLLSISPATAADLASGGNGYWVAIGGAGGFSTNSTMASLSFRTATNLTWNSTGPNTWDVNNSAVWKDPNGNTTVFNYGDTVVFDDTALVKQVNLAGRYLGAASVTVEHTSGLYEFQGSSQGSFAGGGSLLYRGSDVLLINNVNTFAGGTTISNALAYLLLGSYAGLGTGPVKFSTAGAQMEITQVGSATTGLAGDVNVEDDFTIKFDNPGTFSGVFFGNISGTATKTLTFNPATTNSTVNQRIRIYGTSSTYAANLLLNSSLISLAPYLPSGTQIYSGIISGPGGLIQRGNGTTILNGTNTYSGGTTPTTGTIALGLDTTGPAGAVTSGPIGTGPLLVAPEVANITGNGTIIAVNGPRTIGNQFVYPSGTNNQTLIFGSSNAHALTFTGPINMNGADGSNTFTTRTFQVANTALATFAGVISGTGGLVKTGNGILALDATETYGGSTTVSNGTLRVNGQVPGTVLVVTNATLGGTGTIQGAVTIQTNGVLSPGASIGTLTINNNLSYSGNLFIEVNKSLAQSNDLTSVSGTLANNGGGAVFVTNLGPTLVIGDKFFIFNKGVGNGNNMTVVSGSGVGWANNLAVDGSISVSGVLTTAPLITSATVNGSNFAMSGTNGAATVLYYVLASTNLTTPLTGWARVATNTFTAGGGFSASIPIVGSQPQRFYILQVP